MLAVQPMQWSTTPDIEDVAEFDTDDLECLREVRETLRRHGMVDRFGVTLIHSHFEIAADEILMEETDVASRTLRIRPIKLEEARKLDSRPTNWRFTEDETVVRAGCTCRRVGGNHQGDHQYF